MPDAPLASSETWSFVDMQPSLSSRSKLTRVAARRARVELVGVEDGVRRDHDEHRREAGRQHPGALRHAADAPAVARRATAVFGTRVGRHDRARGIRAAVGGQGGGRGGDAGEHLVAVELVADEPGRADQHVAGRDAERLADRLGRRVRGLEALGAR